MKRAVTYPLIGEFGWIIPDVAPFTKTWLRAHSSYHRVVICRRAHRFLFPDCEEFIDIPPSLDTRIQVGRFTRRFQRLPPELASWWDTIPADIRMHPPPQPGSVHTASEADWPWPPTFERLVAPPSHSALLRGQTPYIAVACRARRDMPFKDWPSHLWDALVDWLRATFHFPVLVAGDPHDSYFPKAALKIGCTLEHSVAIFNDALFSISSNCGATHLSLMCGCPTFSWGKPMPHLKRRMELDTNPLGVPCLFQPVPNRTWQPTLEWVQEQVLAFAESLDVPLLR